MDMDLVMGETACLKGASNGLISSNETGVKKEQENSSKPSKMLDT